MCDHINVKTGRMKDGSNHDMLSLECQDCKRVWVCVADDQMIPYNFIGNTVVPGFGGSVPEKHVFKIDDRVRIVVPVGLPIEEYRAVLLDNFKS